MTFKQDLLLYLAAVRIILHRLVTRKKEPVHWLDMRVLCLGLDGAGKTSVLLRAADATATLEGVEPTNGFKVPRVCPVSRECPGSPGVFLPVPLQ